MSGREIALRRRSRRRGALTHQAADQRRRSLLAFAGITALVFAVAIAVVAGTAVFSAAHYSEMAEAAVPAEDLIAEMPRGGARILDRHGELLYEFVDEFGGLRRPVALDNIADSVVLATIATEDPDFWHNFGINVRGTARAGVENFAPFLIGRTEFLEGTGGSSITQQLARNVYMTREEREDRSLDRKLREMVIAVELTERYTKEQILEWYLNSISYGGIYVGIQAAAEGYFGKPAAELTLAEAAVLAGIPQSPARYDPFAPGNFDHETGALAPASLTKSRQGEVLQLMVRHGAITQEEADEAAGEHIEFRQRRFDIEAAHFIVSRIAPELRARWGDEALYQWGLEVTTSLDMNLQRIAEEIIERNITQYGEAAGAYNGAFMAMDPRTSEILVYVGSRDYFRDDIEGRNDNILSRNSPGSTLKPFTYMAAFMQGWGTGTAILDTPLTLHDPGTGREFRPRNPGTGFQGPIRADRALGNSLNIPAIKTMMAAGVDNTLDLYRRAGYTTLDNPGGYGPALTTGGGEVSLFDQVYAYSVLATGGLMRGHEIYASPDAVPGDRELEPVAILRVVDSEGNVLYEFDEPLEERIVEAPYTYLVTEALSNPQNTCITYGACGALSLPNGYPSAAKTGTSEPFENIRAIGETWTIGYTPHLVAGTWAGNTDNAPIHGISSTTVSLRSWQEFMVEAIEYLGHGPTEFERPEGVEERQVCWPSGRLPTSSCPSFNRYTSLYAAEVLPSDPREAPDMYDSWWRGGRLVLPSDEIRGWSGLREWAARHNIGVSGSALVAAGGGQDSGSGSGSGTDSGGGSQAGGGSSGTTEGDGNPADATTDGGALQAVIASPGFGATVSGNITIAGTASGANLSQYQVLIGQGESPSEWFVLWQSQRQVQGGSLTSWNTAQVANGVYTIRLVVTDSAGDSTAQQIAVTVNN